MEEKRELGGEREGERDRQRECKTECREGEKERERMLCRLSTPPDVEKGKPPRGARRASTI